MRRQDLHAAAGGSALRPPGRLLVYFPDADLTDGAAAAESLDFFDIYNAPPWGTWVGYFEQGGRDPSYANYLVSWVPEALVQFADAGIKVNPEECIKWLDQATVEVRGIFDWLTSRLAG